MRTVAIVQSRLSSTRFPRKALADLNGHPMIWHVVNQAARIKGATHVVLAVPEREAGEFIYATRGLSRVIYGHTGVENDVLERFLEVVNYFQADVIIRITGDCPALNPVVAGQVLDLFYASQPCDFASNDTTMSGYPDGWDVEVFSREALEQAAAQATDASDREHVTPWMKRHLRCVTLMAPEPWMGPKLSVDTEADLDVVRVWLNAR